MKTALIVSAVLPARLRQSHAHAHRKLACRQPPERVQHACLQVGERHTVEVGEEIFRENDLVWHAFFPVTAVCSLTVGLKSGSKAEVALVGREGFIGAEKSATLKTVFGLVPPRRGRVIFNGRDITGRPAHEISRAGAALVPETRGIFSYLTTRENLNIAVRGTARWTTLMVLERFPRLAKLIDRPGRCLSGGEQQMLAVGRVLLTGPELLLLDEPSQGLAPIIVEAVIGTIMDLKREGMAMVLVEQNVQLASDLADRVYVVGQGRLVFEGTPAALHADTAILSTYLGVG